ncbi:hypothetical protein H7J06_19555 [Mycobacterium hodleri]|uniref:hypothetical protein n=1 Tax=Mycolicibacterium hodleri TaxID=49897 RepID=UPI0021F338BA|nr:hypothetical protein [Mycolicibacterium hodleri]MCV7135181.1 hypothetical protein [Mycolicibacterium hodleri]
MRKVRVEGLLVGWGVLAYRGGRRELRDGVRVRCIEFVVVIEVGEVDFSDATHGVQRLQHLRRGGNCTSIRVGADARREDE